MKLQEVIVLLRVLSYFIMILFFETVPLTFTASIQNNTRVKSKLNFNCLQMDTWDCFNIKKEFLENEEKNNSSGSKEVDFEASRNRTNANGTVNSTADQKYFIENQIITQSFGKESLKNTSSNPSNRSLPVDSRSNNHVTFVRRRTPRISRQMLPRKEEDTLAKSTDNEDFELKSAESPESFARGKLITRKMWMAILAGIVLKFASLLPLILGKFALLGLASIVSSKFALLIVAIMALRQMFSADKNFGSFPDLGLAGHHHPQQQQQHYGHHQPIMGYAQALSHHGGHAYQPTWPLMGYANLQQAVPTVTHKKWG